MTKKMELYRCNICGNLVQILTEGGGDLVCCEKNMELLTTNNSEITDLNEKHIPIIEKEIEGYKIRVGTKKHPMTDEHYIMFIQAISKDNKYLKMKYLDTNEEPELSIKCKHSDIWARALCNIHGLFKGEYNND